MNFQFSELVSQIIKGLKSYFEKNQIEVNENFYEELMNKLNIELSKPFNEQICTPTQILNDYIKDELKKGTRLNQIMRHTLGLFHGQSGASYWKRYLSENMCVRDADIQKIDHIMDRIKYNNVERRVG